MKITIEEFIPEPKGKRVGWVDFRVDKDDNNSETFRQVPYFEGEKGHWISMPSCERNGIWKPKYERTPPMKEMFNAVLKELDIYLEKNK